MHRVYVVWVARTGWRSVFLTVFTRVYFCVERLNPSRFFYSCWLFFFVLFVVQVYRAEGENAREYSIHIYITHSVV